MVIWHDSELIARSDWGGWWVGLPDTGPGITEANQAKIFDRFFTTERKGETRLYGSGLGLAIAKSIIENHRGTIEVESRPGDGAAFQYQLPCLG